ncbi:hypothetical protein AAZX31_20G140200 [Glycine max]
MMGPTFTECIILVCFHDAWCNLQLQFTHVDQFLNVQLL